jgi:FlaA1/EpsC-like NDP-sugar epimerase
MSSISIGRMVKPQNWIFGKSLAWVAKAAAKAGSAHRSLLILGCESMLAAVSYAFAVYLLSDTQEAGWAFKTLRATLAFLILFRVAGLVSVGLHRRSLRYACIPDLLSIGKIALLTSLFFGAFVWWRFPGLGLPTALFIFDWLFLQILWGGLHFAPRIFKTRRGNQRHDRKRVLIVGAGDAGMTLLKELMTDPSSVSKPVALVDDDPAKSGRSMYGVQVYQGTKNIAQIAAELQAQEILVCVPTATASQICEILAACRKSQLPVRTLPSLIELADEKVPRWQAESPTIAQLMERPEIRIDLGENRRIVGGKVVLVTGAGGSIGAELCRQIAEASPKKMMLVDKSENSLFYVHREVAARLSTENVRPVLLDILQRERLRELLYDEGPEIIFHAAAHKHVGLMELHPQEAIRNNVMGTRNVAEAALECGCTRFVNISTDKAVSPRSYMGLSKKLAELYIQELARSHRKAFCNVRFGNVAGSSGSVLKLFWEQIQKREPILVTDPRATRYFMSIPEAVHLILRAAALGNGGETFVLDMGEPMNIYELAKGMMFLAGLKPGRDLPIQFIGLKEGEKIEEELWAEWERPVRSDAERIFKITEQNPMARGILGRVRKMDALLSRDDREGLLDYLREIEPEFKEMLKEAIVSTPGVPAIPTSALNSVSAA